MGRTRADFDAQTFGDELRGLLMRSFAEASRSAFTDHAANGAEMKKQMQAGQALLGRIFDFLSEPLPAKASTNGTHLPARKT